jgi:hypothetical protein
VSSARGDAAAANLESGDPSGAFLIALSGDDRGLSDKLLARVEPDQPVEAIIRQALAGKA